jgi:hypothetical protein
MGGPPQMTADGGLTVAHTVTYRMDLIKSERIQGKIYKFKDEEARIDNLEKIKNSKLKKIQGSWEIERKFILGYCNFC